MRRKAWTEAENDIIRNAIQRDGLKQDEICSLLPHRTPLAVKRQRAKLRVERHVLYSESDPRTVVEIVKFKMAGWRYIDISRVTGVSVTRLSWLVCRQGIRVPKVVKQPSNKKRWTELELVTLRRALKRKVPLLAIYQMFPDRTMRAVEKKIYQITRYWLSDAEKEKRRRQRQNEMRWRVY